MGIDRSIDGLLEAYAAAGVEVAGGASPDQMAAIDEIGREVAPRRVPADVRRVWERLDVEAVFSKWLYPQLTDPAFALQSRRDDVSQADAEEGEPLHPDGLLLVGYESWACMSVELELDGATSGGALFEWRLDSPAFIPRYDSIGAWIERLTALIVAGDFDRQSETHLLVADPDTERPLDELGRVLDTAPWLAGATLVSEWDEDQDAVPWPSHWHPLAP